MMVNLVKFLHLVSLNDNSIKIIQAICRGNSKILSSNISSNCKMMTDSILYDMDHFRYQPIFANACVLVMEKESSNSIPAANGFRIVLSEIGNRIMVGSEAFHQPHQFDVAFTFLLLCLEDRIRLR